MGSKGIFDGRPQTDGKVAVISEEPEVVLIDRYLGTAYDVIKEVVTRLDQIEILNQTIYNMSAYIPHIHEMAINGANGINGGGYLVDNPTITLDFSTLEEHSGTVDLVKDSIAICDGSSDKTQSISVNAFKTALISDVVALTGVPQGTKTLGQFAGSMIPDHSTIRGALQAIETASEAGFATMSGQIDTKLAAGLATVDTRLDAVESTIEDLIAHDEAIDLDLADIKDKVGDVQTGLGSTKINIDSILYDLAGVTSTIDSQTLTLGALEIELDGKATTSAVSALEVGMSSVNDDLIAQAALIDAVTVELEDKASAEAFDLLVTRVTETEGTLDVQAIAITALSSEIEDKAEATAITELTTQVTDIDGKVSAVATALTEISAGTTPGDVSSVSVKMTAVSAPDAWAARYAIMVRGGDGLTFQAAGFFMDVASGGLSRIAMRADKLVLTDGSLAHSPFFILDGVVHLDDVNIENAQIGSLIVGRINIADGAIDEDKVDKSQLLAPTGLTLSQDESDPDSDGSVNIALFADWTDMGDLYKNYEVEFFRSNTAGGTYTSIDTKKMKNNRTRFGSGKSTKWYKARIRGFNFSNTPGHWSALTDPFQPTQTTTAPEKAVIVNIVGRSKGNKILTQECAASDYLKTRMWRYTSLANATADTGGTFLGGQAGEIFIDNDDLPDSTEYWYRAAYVNRAKLVGPKSDPYSSQTAAAMSAVPAAGSITDSMLSTAAPGVVGAPGLHVRQRKDAGGELKTQIVASWTAPASSVPIKSYEVRIYDGTDFDYRTTKNLSVRFDAVVGLNYVVYVQAISAFGVGSGFVNPNNVTPGLVSTTLPSPSAPYVNRKMKRNRVYWTIPNDKDFSHVRLYNYIDQLLYKGNSTFWIDEGPEWTSYKLSFVDKQGNETSKSSSAAMAGGSITPEVDTENIVDGAVTTTKIANSQVTAAKIAANAITRSELQSGVAGAAAKASIGTATSGSVNAGSGNSTFLSVTMKATAAATGVTVTLGSMSWTSVAFAANGQYTFTTTESGGGTFSYSRSGGSATQTHLSAVTVY